MNKMPWFRFYPADWIKGTRELSEREKAIWIDLLAYMWESLTRGKIVSDWQGIARMVGVPWLECESAVKGMVDKGFLNLTDHNGIITLISRRMVREENIRESNRLRQKKHYNAQPNAQPNANLTDKTQKSEVITTTYTGGRPSFQKPSLEELRGYLKSKKSPVDAETFFAFYESNGWRVGKNPMRNWKAAVVTWEKKRASEAKQPKQEAPHWSEIPTKITTPS